MKCACCYCGSKQEVEPPPGLHTCTSCKKDFRTYRLEKGVKPMELSKEAQERYIKGFA